MSGYLTLVSLLLPALFSPRLYRYYYYILVEPWAAIAFAVGLSIWLMGPSKLNRSVAAFALAIALAVGLVQVRYQALAPSTGFSVPISQVCCYVSYAPLISNPLQKMCDQTDKICHINWPDIFARQEQMRK
jgi:hypothetical protein